MSAVDLLGPGNALVGVLETYAQQYTEIKRTFHQVIQNSILIETPNTCNGSEVNVEATLLRDRLRFELKKFEASAEEELKAALSLKEWVEMTGSQTLKIVSLSVFAQEAIPQVKRWQRSAHARIFARTSELAELKKFLDELLNFINLISSKLTSIGSSSPFITGSGCETPQSSPGSVSQSSDSRSEVFDFTNIASTFRDNKLLQSLCVQFLFPWLLKHLDADDETEAYELISGILGASTAFLGMLASLVARQRPSNQEEFELGCYRLMETQRALRSLRELLVEHSMVSVDKALSNIWRHVLHNLEMLQDWGSKLTSEEIGQVKQRWIGVSEAVDGMANILLSSLLPPVEIHDVVSVMDNIQEDFKNVRQQFRELLEVPHLHILQVDDPFRSQASAERIEQHTGVDQPKVGLIPVIRRFNKEYQELEDESRRIMEELCFYAATQVNLLSSIGRPGGFSLENYLSDREEHVARLKQEVSTVFRIKEKHRLLKGNWESLQGEMRASLVQQEQDIGSYDKKIDRLVNEDKLLEEKLFRDLLQVLSGSGSICSTIALSLAPQVLAVVSTALLAAGVAPVICTWAWSQYNAKQRKAVISACQEVVKECRKKVETLTSARPYMENIAQSLAKLVDLSGGIFRNVDAVCRWREVYTNCFVGLQPSIVAKWRDTERMCETYLALTKNGGDGTASEIAGEIVDPNHAVLGVAL